MAKALNLIGAALNPRVAGQPEPPPDLSHLIERRLALAPEALEAEVALQVHYIKRISALQHILASGLFGAARCVESPVVLFAAANSMRMSLEAAVALRHLLDANGPMETRLPRYLADMIRTHSSIQLSFLGQRFKGNDEAYHALARCIGATLSMDKSRFSSIDSPFVDKPEQVSLDITANASRFGYAADNLNYYRFLSLWTHGNGVHSRMSLSGQPSTVTVEHVLIAITKAAIAVVCDTTPRMSNVTQVYPDPQVLLPALDGLYDVAERLTFAIECRA